MRTQLRIMLADFLSYFFSFLCVGLWKYIFLFFWVSLLLWVFFLICQWRRSNGQWCAWFPQLFFSFYFCKLWNASIMFFLLTPVKEKFSVIVRRKTFIFWPDSAAFWWLCRVHGYIIGWFLITNCARVNLNQQKSVYLFSIFFSIYFIRHLFTSVLIVISNFFFILLLLTLVQCIIKKNQIFS